MKLLHLDMESDENGGRWTTMVMYSTVSYDEHFKCLTRFGNPYKLYTIEKTVDN